MQDIRVKVVDGKAVAAMVPTDVPQTSEEFEALILKRSELSSQLQSATGRREEFANQLKTADPSARPGIEARLKVLDDRIVRLEGEIDKAGDLIANAPPGVRTSQTEQLPPILEKISNDLVPMFAIFSVFVLLPFTIAISRFIWRRAVPPGRPAIDHPTQQRLEQMQQSIDTIAIEVERISEGQRYMTKMMGEGRAIGAGPADPMRAPLRTAVSSDRD